MLTVSQDSWHEKAKADKVPPGSLPCFSIMQQLLFMVSSCFVQIQHDWVHSTDIGIDIFRTNDKDRNISDSSSYLDLSPLYGYTEEMQRKVRDDKYKLGLLKPDTFAEDRLLRQPPGVCIMLVMYNRYVKLCQARLRILSLSSLFAAKFRCRPSLSTLELSLIS